MKNKKIFFLLLTILIIILFFLFVIIKNYFVTKETNSSFVNYTPEEEIGNKEIKNTTITLYFLDSNNQIKPERRLIDSSILLENPYKYLCSLLIEGPKSEELHSCFPQNTNILNATMKNGLVVLDFTDSLLNYSDESQRLNIINCLLNTLSELNEVNSIKFLINNEFNTNFSDEYTVN